MRTKYMHEFATLALGIFQDRYKLLSTLEVGGCSVVFKVMHLENKDVCALKLITHPRLIDEAAKEIKVLKAFDALVESQSFIGINPTSHEEQPFTAIIMPFIPGIRLDKYLADHKNLPLQERLYLMLQITEQLNTIHSNNIIHGDVAPSNFIINPLNLKIKIIDFGWSNIVDGTNHLSDGVEIYYWGWRWFNAPEYEHFKGLEGGKLILKPASDIYALGNTIEYILGNADPARFQAQPNSIRNPSIDNLIASMVCVEPNRRAALPEVKDRLIEIASNIAKKTTVAEKENPAVSIRLTP